MEQIAALFVEIIVRFLWEIGAAVFMETCDGVSKKRRFRDQSSEGIFRATIQKLDSPVRAEKLEAVWQLKAIGNVEAIPALIRATRREASDIYLMVNVIRTMESLGDERALPSLRSLAERGGPTVAKAAMAAIASLEARSSLLRASQKPEETGTTLLRPAGIGSGTEPHLLLRASQKSENSTDQANLT